MRPDLFVKKHVVDLDSQLTLAFSKAVKRNESNQNDENDQKASIMPNKDRSTKSILIPQIRSNTNYHVPLLPNGSEIQRKKETIVLSHSCGCDSLVSVYGAIYIDQPITQCYNKK